MFPDCTAATILKMATKNLYESRFFLIMWNKPLGYYFLSSVLGVLPFLNYQAARWHPPWWWQHFSSRKAILYDNIIMHLSLSCTHCDLDQSCCILHMSRDTVTWSSFTVGRAMEVSIKTLRGTLPDCTAARKLITAKNLVETRSLLIMLYNRPGDYISPTNLGAFALF